MRRAAWGWVAVLAVASLLGWLPFVGRSLSPDEGGYLIVGSHWSEGSSLYGDYWVDRPPGLVGIFAAADWLGGATALRLLGALAVVLTVVLAGVLGRVAAPGRRYAPVATAAAAAILTATPLFGGSVVNGELFGLPFVMAGVVALVRAHTTDDRRSVLAWGIAAGAAAVLAALVKQSTVDVFVMALALLVSQSRSVRAFAGVLEGAAVTLAIVLVAAFQVGTSPADLWDAVVTFRFDAAEVLAESASPSVLERFGGLFGALALSIAPLLVGTLAWSARRPPAREPGPGVPPDLRWAAYAVLAWELVVVVLGGSYWLHYLMGLVPGVVLLAAAAVQRPGPVGRLVVACYALAALSTVSVIAWVGVYPIDRPEEPVIDYLAATAEPGDTAIVAFGGANILRDVGLECPYPYLWSLPARVHDPDLDTLTAVLAGPERPTWLVVRPGSMEPWGLDFTEAQQVVDDHYAVAAEFGRFVVYRLQTDA